MSQEIWIPLVVFGLVLGGIATALLAFLEEILVGSFGGASDAQGSLAASFRRVQELRSSSGPAPRLVVISDPFPYAWCARSVFGPGVIAVSGGLIKRCNEDGLRSILSELCERLESREIVLQSICGLILLGFYRLVPERWIRGSLKLPAKTAGGPPSGEDPSFTLTLGSALRFLLVLPWIRFFSKMIRQARMEPWSKKSMLHEKLGIERIYLPTCIDKPEAYAACYQLYVVDPWSKTVLFPLFE